MTSHSFSQKRFIPVPPEKGSFPLDHENVCKRVMIAYMRCLRDNSNDNTQCRAVAKDYLECRMQHNLMAKESWSNLGFAEMEQQQQINNSST